MVQSKKQNHWAFTMGYKILVYSFLCLNSRIIEFPFQGLCKMPGAQLPFPFFSFSDSVGLCRSHPE